MYLIDLKTILKLILSSIVIVLVLFFSIYGFEMRTIYIANSIFFTGISYFLTGLVVVTNCGEVFAGVTYLTKKMFARKDKKFFRTYGEYKDFRSQNSKNKDKAKEVGYVVLALGLVYIVISVIIGFF